jgi:endothelin-converting enzyme
LRASGLEKPVISLHKPVAFALCLGLVGIAACHKAAEPLTSGIDLTAMDKDVRPQDDLFRYVNGSWLANTPFPTENSRAGIKLMLYEKSLSDMQAILLEAVSTGARASSDMQRLGDFYTSYMDEKTVEARGVGPLKPILDEIAAIDEPSDLARFFGHAKGFGIPVPMGIKVDPDARNATHNIAYVEQDGLGLPSREYYLSADDTYTEVREKYVNYVAQLLTLAGEPNGAARGARILALETKLATAQWPLVENQDPVKTYNKHGLASAASLAPAFDWKAWHAATGLPAGDFIVRQPSYATTLGQLAHAEDLATWKDYLRVRTLNAYATALPAAYFEASFDFNWQTLYGTEIPGPRWKWAIDEANAAMGEAVGREYVARHFPPEVKARMLTLVENLLAEFDRGIDQLDWMSAPTKAEAHTKLKKIKVKIGCPDKWRDYTGLEVRADDLVGNVMRARQFNWSWEATRAGKPKDPSEWLMRLVKPQDVNAYYMPENNEIAFAAAILQPPYFDLRVDDAVNYGAIGSVIGHEISHGFDDWGRQYDGDGNLRDWWAPEDSEKFKARAARLAQQYSVFEPLPGLHVNGELTLGENIGDLSGAAVAYRAYIASLNGAEPPVIDGFTGAQRFFLGYGQSWREKLREGLLRANVLGDDHAPEEFRVNGVVANMDEFHAAFGVQEGDSYGGRPRSALRSGDPLAARLGFKCSSLIWKRFKTLGPGLLK